jgi:hypothetical protein
MKSPNSHSKYLTQNIQKLIISRNVQFTCPFLLVYIQDIVFTAQGNAAAKLQDPSGNSIHLSTLIEIDPFFNS